MKANKPHILGLTGGIACGKSHISRTLRRLGATIIDADRISHELTQSDAGVLSALRAAFGDDYFLADGQMNRPAMARLVFANPQARKALEGILHPAIFCRINQSIEEGAHQTVIVLDIPLLFETGSESLCDEVWCAYTHEEDQLSRLKRRGYPREEALQRINSQMPAAEKCQRADCVIDTSGSFEQTDAHIQSLWNNLIRRVSGVHASDQSTNHA